MQSWPTPELDRLPGVGPLPHVHDTATGERRAAATGSRASMYVCGITPYDATHAGHAATYVGFDTLHRALLDADVAVDYCQNVTDVDDPLLERAAATGEDWAALATRQIALFRDDMTALRVVPPRWYVGAVEAIPEIVELVSALRDKDAAYDVDGDIYFSIAAASHFGAVANLDAETMLRLSAETGGDPDRIGKKDPLDPLLWQAARPGEPAWDSPLGRGRPGWHIECAAIALGRLGAPIDVQGGGRDLAFPHHELGAAEATAVSGTWPFARAFVHAGMVGYEGEKMSKSRGNLVFISALRRDAVDPGVIRLALLAHHYREDWEWTAADLAAARDRVERWRFAVRRPAGAPADRVLAAVRSALADDLDTPAALAAVDRWAAAAGSDPDAPALARRTADTLLGVAL